MKQEFRRILCPVDFDDNSMKALDTAADLARENNGTVFVLARGTDDHNGNRNAGLFRSLQGAGRGCPDQAARDRAQAAERSQVRTPDSYGRAGGHHLKCRKENKADLVVMATHGRRGFKRFLLGSIAEVVLRESTCPVLTVRCTPTQNDMVATWMTKNPVTATPHENLASIAANMHAGGFRCVPILGDGAPVGIVTDRDIRQHTGYLDQTEAFKAMSEPLITVTPSTDIREAARLLRERKIGALPVVEDGKLVGVITTDDVLEALTQADHRE